MKVNLNNLRMFLSVKLQRLRGFHHLHYIIRRFSKSREISVHKGQGQKPILNVHELLRSKGPLLQTGLILLIVSQFKSGQLIFLLPVYSNGHLKVFV